MLISPENMVIFSSSEMSKALVEFRMTLLGLAGFETKHLPEKAILRKALPILYPSYSPSPP